MACFNSLKSVPGNKYFSNVDKVSYMYQGNDMSGMVLMEIELVTFLQLAHTAGREVLSKKKHVFYIFLLFNFLSGSGAKSS